MSYRGNTRLLVASKVAIWVSLIAILIYIIASILFYFIGEEVFTRLQSLIFSNPLTYFIPVLLVLGITGVKAFREEEGWQTKSSRRSARSTRSFATIVGVCLLAIAAYYLVSNNLAGQESPVAKVSNNSTPTTLFNEPANYDMVVPRNTPTVEKEVVKDSSIIPPAKPALRKINQEEQFVSANNSNTFELKYKVISKAYLYSSPDESTRRNAFINHNSSYSTLYPKDEKNGFVYVVFTSKNGQTTTGWLNKKDLKPVNELVYNSGK
ncbi:MAG: hypothetical protein JWQ96_1105 [Segetibacter sp.]|nr:hypothetical protein [Segetibacter sp.]